MSTLQSEDCQTNDLNDLFPMSIESLRLPLDSSTRIIFTGYYTGFNVEVRSADEIGLLYHMGCFGKGSTSRSRPKLSQNDGVYIIRKRQFQIRNNWYKKFDGSRKLSDSQLFLKEIDDLVGKMIEENDISNSGKKDVIDLVSSDDEDADHTENLENTESGNVKDHSKNNDIYVIVPNSDSEEENYFANMKPKYCTDQFKIEEKLMLTLQEAFYLVFGLGCLQVINIDNQILNIENCWNTFTATDKNFLNKYVVYHYLRSKGYVVKPGIKFGGDYLLYRDGPGVRHADYIVLIKSNNEMDNWVLIHGLMRVANTTSKELMLVEVIEPKGKVKLPEDLSTFSVREMVFTKNLPVTINDNE